MQLLIFCYDLLFVDFKLHNNFSDILLITINFLFGF